MTQSNETHADYNHKGHYNHKAQSEIQLSVKPSGNFSFNPYDWSAWKKGFKDRHL